MRDTLKFNCTDPGLENKSMVALKH